MINENDLRTLIEKYTEGTTKFLVNLKVTNKGDITVEMDGDDGFTISDCTLLSRHIEQHLNRDEEDYSLEVASCGVGNPLKLPRQFIKNCGRLVKVQTRDGNSLTGRLLLADEQGIQLEIKPIKPKKGVIAPNPEPVGLGYAQITHAIVEIEF
jgi:ribosome maturation factor RimP